MEVFGMYLNPLLGDAEGIRYLYGAFLSNHSACNQ